MISFMFLAENLPFAAALLLLLAIGVLEGVLLFFGAGFASVLESLVPQVDLDGPPSPTGEGALSRLLGWLHIGRVPVLILLVVFLAAFGLIGLLMQGILHGVTGLLLPAWLAVAPAFLLSLPVVRVAGHGIAMIIPKDETEAVTESSFVGRVAVITLGTARQGGPAQAKLKDIHGYTHYVMVEPEAADETFATGTAVLLVSQQGAVFRAIVNPSGALVD